MTAVDVARQQRAAAIADRIEAELRRLGRWSETAIDPARLVDMGAFGQKTLAAEEWIQFVLVSRIREIVATTGEFPPTSEAAAWATREFDGDPDADALVGLLRELDALIEGPTNAARAEALVAAVAAGDLARIREVLEDDVDPNTAVGGTTPLHVAAAAAHPALATLLATPFDVDLATILLPDLHPDYVPIAELLVAHGADVNARAEPNGLTPLMVAAYFGHAALVGVLSARGADASLRDTWGRSAERLAVFQTVARVIQFCRRMPMIAAAYVTQIHTPVSHQYTTPALGLELSAGIPTGAFADWPPEHPIVVFVMGDDALSRLAKLAPPVYRKPVVAKSRAAADAIAAAVGGSVREIPSEAEYLAFGVALPDGRVPVLVREFRHAVGICVSHGKSLKQLVASPDDTILPEAIEATRAWATARDLDVATLNEIAIELAAALSEEFSERWTVSIPGTYDPTEMWLHGANRDAAAVGVFGGRAIVWRESEAREIQFPSRELLATRRPAVVAAVREQRALYERNLALGDQIRALAASLIAKLSSLESQDAPRFPGCSLAISGAPTHSSTIQAAITCDDPDGGRRDIVHITCDAGAITIHSGLVGRDGVDSRPDELDADFKIIVAAIARCLTTLTLDRLEVGRRYRVLEGIGGLDQGAIVKYVGYDDIDNHYGKHDFETADGQPVAVSGDFSRPQYSPLGEVHRYLEPLPD